MTSTAITCKYLGQGEPHIRSLPASSTETQRLSPQTITQSIETLHKHNPNITSTNTNNRTLPPSLTIEHFPNLSDSPPTTTNMSAPNAGRQSPEPEKQSNAQTGATSTNVNDQGQAKSNDAPAEDSKNTLKNLESNPKGPLDDEAEKKTSKTT
ncbi:hypothetical protein LTR22_021575 [Elasticomyces elasticus]|nr:hypothetical protein LTR22_021575 [Elasticomyces elasticus]KAK5754747.1 hypothetical protein LTS12_015158 [Elasticomyces elasticus]